MKPDFAGVALWGFVATLILTTIMYLAQGMGVSRISLPFMIGTAFTGNRDRAEYLGVALHFVLGWSLCLIYAFIFEDLKRSGWVLGLILGTGHGLFMLAVVMSVLPYIHPRMSTEHDRPTPTRMLEPPGFMGLNYGRKTPISTMIAHMAFGTVFGAFYTVA
jgi:hypothetical protein